MKKIQLLSKFKGSTGIEYAILCALIASVSIGAIIKFGDLTTVNLQSTTSELLTAEAQTEICDNYPEWNHDIADGVSYVQSRQFIEDDNGEKKYICDCEEDGSTIDQDITFDTWANYDPSLNSQERDTVSIAVNQTRFFIARSLILPAAPYVDYEYIGTETIEIPEEKYFEGCYAYTPAKTVEKYLRPDGTIYEVQIGEQEIHQSENLCTTTTAPVEATSEAYYENCFQITPVHLVETTTYPDGTTEEKIVGEEASIKSGDLCTASTKTVPVPEDAYYDGCFQVTPVHLVQTTTYPDGTTKDEVVGESTPLRSGNLCTTATNPVAAPQEAYYEGCTQITPVHLVETTTYPDGKTEDKIVGEGTSLESDDLCTAVTNPVPAPAEAYYEGCYQLTPVHLVKTTTYPDGSTKDEIVGNSTPLTSDNLCKASTTSVADPASAYFDGCFKVTPVNLVETTLYPDGSTTKKITGQGTTQRSSNLCSTSTASVSVASEAYFDGCYKVTPVQSVQTTKYPDGTTETKPLGYTTPIKSGNLCSISTADVKATSEAYYSGCYQYTPVHSVQTTKYPDGTTQKKTIGEKTPIKSGNLCTVSTADVKATAEAYYDGCYQYTPVHSVQTTKYPDGTSVKKTVGEKTPIKSGNLCTTKTVTSNAWAKDVGYYPVTGAQNVYVRLNNKITAYHSYDYATPKSITFTKSSSYSKAGKITNASTPAVLKSFPTYFILKHYSLKQTSEQKTYPDGTVKTTVKSQTYANTGYEYYQFAHPYPYSAYYSSRFNYTVDCASVKNKTNKASYEKYCD